jgi:hypothetical protein
MSKKQRMTLQQREMALYEGAVETFGEIPQIDQAIEEMAELTVALNKYKRHVRFGQGTHQDVLQRVSEERADVSIPMPTRT